MFEKSHKTHSPPQLASGVGPSRLSLVRRRASRAEGMKLGRIAEALSGGREDEPVSGTLRASEALLRHKRDAKNGLSIGEQIRWNPP